MLFLSRTGACAHALVTPLIRASFCVERDGGRNGGGGFAQRVSFAGPLFAH
jgi:hypothetical protein